MTQTEIECFLAICRYKTVSRAAEALYITQPSLSARLKTLESELGGTLFNRKSGNREMTLTAAGNRFYKLALEYESVTNQMRNVFKKESELLIVSAINSISTYFLPQVYSAFLKKSPRYRLEIQDMELDAAKKSILNGTTDLAFTSGTTDDERFVQTPLFLEPSVLICGKKLRFSRPVSVRQLRQKKEIFVNWCSSFLRWHQQVFIGDPPPVTISIMPQLKQFMEEGDAWAIVPISVANGLAQDCDVRRCETAFDLPSRRVSIVTADGADNKAIRDFLECIRVRLREMPEVQPLL